MMRKSNKPNNLWLLLALPFVGGIGWIASRFISRQQQGKRAQPAVIEQKSEIPPQSWETATKMAEPREQLSRQTLIKKPERASLFFALLAPFLILATAVILLALYRFPVQSQTIVPGGNPKAGQEALQNWGCGSCHTIQGVTGANGKVGPALAGLSDRSFIAGRLQNKPENMMLWIMHPQQIAPGVDMPDTGVPEDVARDMAAYLYSIH